jgi:hypothetical protein
VSAVDELPMNVCRFCGLLAVCGYCSTGRRRSELELFLDDRNVLGYPLLPGFYLLLPALILVAKLLLLLQDTIEFERVRWRPIAVVTVTFLQLRPRFLQTSFLPF